MDRINTFLKWTLIAFLVVVITVLHYSTGGGHTGLHIIYRELYFLPILLSCIWFGLYQGLGTSVVIGLIYLPHAFIYSDPHRSPATVSVQILVFVAIAAVLGVLTERQRQRQQQAADVERLEVLGRAASIVGEEINTSLGILRGALMRPDATEIVAAPQYARELDRLHEIVDVLITFRSIKPDGHGLALAASRKYLREIGGDIRVENEPEKGARFTVVIPREDVKALLNGSA
jgi:signal transduction histidine kinase